MPPQVQQAMEVQLALWHAQLALTKEKPWLAGYLLRQSVRLRDRLVRMSRRLLVLLSLTCSRRWWKRFKKALPSLVAGSALLLALGLNAPSAGAANILVTTTADTVGDDGVTSLREAITMANANPGEDTIDLTTVSGTIGLGSDLPDITESAQFNGPGPDNLSIDAGGGYEGLNGVGFGTNIGVDGLTITNVSGVGVGASNNATVSNSTVTGGYVGVGAYYDATVSNSTVTGSYVGVYAVNDATVSNSTVSSTGYGFYFYYGSVYAGNKATVTNSTVTGGFVGVSAYYDATVTNSTVSGYLTGVSAYNNATVTNSTVSSTGYGFFFPLDPFPLDPFYLYFVPSSVFAHNNATVTHSTVSGGVIGVSAYYDATVTNSTVSGYLFGVLAPNSATVTRSTVSGYLAGVFTANNATVTNSTISEGSCAGIFAPNPGGTLRVSHSTISGNSGYGIDAAGTVFLNNSIVAGNNGGGPDLYGPFNNNTSSFNLIGNGDGSGLTNGVNSNQLGSTGALLNPRLGPLDDNGGFTRTRALLEGSPAIDSANPDTCPGTDQRGTPRPLGFGCDIGSFEYGSADTDGDGVNDIWEQGPHRDDPDLRYDGNGDRIPDWLQDNVSSFPTTTSGGTDGYVSLEVPSTQRLWKPRDLRNFDTPPPAGVSFPYGFFSFTVKDVDPGGETTVTFHLDGLPPQTHYKYGPTPGNSRDHWYEFFYDGTTGVEKVEDTMVLHLVDGARGDHDLMANGEIVDPGGPAAIASREVLNFPYIAIADGSDTELSIINGEHYEVSGNVTYYGEDGELVGMYLLSVDAKGKVRLGSQGAIVPGAASGVVNADGRLAGYTRYLSPEGKMCSWPGSRKTATSIGVPFCRTGPEWRTGLALFNPNPEEVVVTIDLDSGEEMELDLGAREQELVWLEGTECATRITASGRISAVEMFDSLVDGGDLAAVLLEGTSSSSLYVPTISFAEGSFTQVGILNGSWDSGTIVTGYDGAGGTEEDLGIIEAQSQVEVDLSSSFSPDTEYAEVWGKVVEVTPMGTPVAMYQGLVSYGEDGTEKLGSVKLNALGFTEGFIGVAASDLAPTFGLVNPGGVDATVAVTGRDGAGTVVSTSSVEIPAGSNLTGLVSDLLGDASLDEVSHIQLQSNVEIYGLETSYPGIRMEVLPVLAVK